MNVDGEISLEYRERKMTQKTNQGLSNMHKKILLGYPTSKNVNSKSVAVALVVYCTALYLYERYVWEKGPWYAHGFTVQYIQNTWSLIITVSGGETNIGM